MTKEDLAQSIECKLFADRKTMKEAYDYAMAILKDCGKKNEGIMLTAIHVLLNTLAKNIRLIENKKI